MASELEVYKRRALVRGAECLSLEDREIRDRNNIAHGKLGHGGKVGLRSVVPSVPIVYVLLFEHICFPFP